MEELIYKPDIYDGLDPYLHISYHSNDRKTIEAYLRELNKKGFRFWISDAISMGKDVDEEIALHIERCGLFVAFISKEYLNFLDVVDELNYSRDVDKNAMLIYLEDVILPSGLDMRFGKNPRINAYALKQEEAISQLININGADAYFGITDEKLRQKADRLIGKMEELYPDHRYFAIDSINRQLSKDLSELYVEAGYPSRDRLLQDYGFTRIEVEQARKYRNDVVYEPGNEPECIKPRVDYILTELQNAYPEHQINDALSKVSGIIKGSLSGLSAWLGYESSAELLNAYGYEGVVSESGRISIDHEFVIRQLMEKYANTAKPGSISELVSDNPQHKANLKTISNRSRELFGTSLQKYFKSIGLIVPKEKIEKSTLTAQNRVLIIEEIKKLYESGIYGAYEDCEETIKELTLKKNIKGQIYISDSNSDSKTVVIPEGVDFIDKEVFAGQVEMERLVLPSSLKEIKEAAFMDCVNLKEVVFPEGLIRIHNSAFENCGSLTQISLPESLQSVGNDAFAGCEQLSDVVFKNHRTNIQEDAFDGCVYELKNLQEENASPAEFFELKVAKNNTAKIIKYKGNEQVVVIPSTISGHPIAALDGPVFKDNRTITEVYIDDRVETVNGEVFKGCTNLMKIHLPEMASSLSKKSFDGCSSLSEINIPDNVVTLSGGLFADSPLTTIYIGKSVDSINPDAFYKGKDVGGTYMKKRSLETLIIDNENMTYSANGTMLLSKDGSILYAELGNPKVAEIPEGVVEIAEKAYGRLSGLCEVKFPSTLKVIGEKAFETTGLTYVEIPESVMEIHPQAFSFCRKLNKLDMYDGLKIIGSQAFEGCPIKDVYIPASVEWIGHNGFMAISSFKGEIGQSFVIDSANSYLFTDDKALYSRKDDTQTLITAYADELYIFRYNEPVVLVAYKVDESTTHIADSAFAAARNLETVELPAGLKEIGVCAFKSCMNLKNINIPETCQVLDDAFSGTGIIY